jgi:hypothetical protein
MHINPYTHKYTFFPPSYTSGTAVLSPVFHPVWDEGLGGLFLNRYYQLQYITLQTLAAATLTIT